MSAGASASICRRLPRKRTRIAAADSDFAAIASGFRHDKCLSSGPQRARTLACQRTGSLQRRRMHKSSKRGGNDDAKSNDGKTSSDRRSTPSVRAGFTLVELLVVIAIIVTLAALLLPAMSASARSRPARRPACRTCGSSIWARHSSSMPTGPICPIAMKTRII